MRSGATPRQALPRVRETLMPRPIPPPPPQPSAEETVHAVRYLRKVVAVGLLFFLVWSQVAYGPASFMAPYGRDSSQSWMIHKVSRIVPAQLRAHDGGHIVWLVGSSILRESLDMVVVNEALEQRGSEYRVKMFCQGRGAAGTASGMVKHLPIEPGDLVIHNVAVQNMRADWLGWTGLPATRMSRMLTPAELWDIHELSLAERLEQAAAVPWNFWRWHDDTRNGLTRWIVALAEGDTPRRKAPGIFNRYSKQERAKIFAEGVPDWEIDRNKLTEDVIDFSDQQFNMQGLARLRAHVSKSDVELVLFDIPPSAYAQWRLESPEVRQTWLEWRSAQPEMVHLPQLPDSHFYDRRHPNFRGREVLSTWLVDWLTEGRPQGSPSIPPESAAIDYPWNTAAQSSETGSDAVEDG